MICLFFESFSGNFKKWRLVPSTNYFLVDENDRVLAMVDIRHDLMDYLHKVGGRIGYGVRPPERRKGHATWILVERCSQLFIRIL